MRKRGKWKKGRGAGWRKNGEGMNLDTLYKRGKIPTDLYYRYLMEYERQLQNGLGRKAIGRMVDGRLYYEMTIHEDYTFDFDAHHFYEALLLPSDRELADLDRSFKDSDSLDYRTALVRELDKGASPVYSLEDRDMDVSANWSVCGHNLTRFPDDTEEQYIDGLLSAIEDG